MSALIRSSVKRVARGTVSGPINSTLNAGVAAVNMSKSVVNILGQTFDVAVGLNDVQLMVDLSTSTNIRFSPSTGAAAAGFRFVSWELIEYN